MSRESESVPKPLTLAYTSPGTHPQRPSLGFVPVGGISLAIACIFVVNGWSGGVTDWYHQRGAFLQGPLFDAAEKWGIAIPAVTGLLVLLAIFVETMRRVIKRRCTFWQWWWIAPVFGAMAIGFLISIAMIEMELLP